MMPLNFLSTWWPAYGPKLYKDTEKPELLTSKGSMKCVKGQGSANRQALPLDCKRTVAALGMNGMNSSGSYAHIVEFLSAELVFNLVCVVFVFFPDTFSDAFCNCEVSVLLLAQFFLGGCRHSGRVLRISILPLEQKMGFY